MPNPRGTTTQRGYGTAHRRERKRWEPRVNAGQADCARCGEPIKPDDAWDLGHTDDRTAWTGPEHAGRCNRSAGGTTSATLKAHTTRNW